MQTPARDEHAALLAEVARGDERALAALYDAHASHLLAFIVKLLGRREGAEEVLAEVFRRVWLTAPEFDPRRSPARYWLVRLARDLALAARKEHVSPPQGKMEASAPASVAHRALAVLEAGEREVLEMAFYDGLTVADIAIRRGEEPDVVKRRVRSALTKLRDHRREHREVSTA